MVFAEELHDKEVYYGGPCSRGMANVVHSCSAVEGATEIVQVRLREGPVLQRMLAHAVTRHRSFQFKIKV